MIRLTLPKATLSCSATFLAPERLLVRYLSGEHIGVARSEFLLWDIGIGSRSVELPESLHWVIHQLFQANAATHLRIQGLWPEGSDLPPPVSGERSTPRVFAPGANYYPLCYHPDGATIIFCEYGHSHGDSYHIRGSKGRRLSPLVGSRGDQFLSGTFSPSGCRLAMRGRTEVKVWAIPTDRRSLCKFETAKGRKEVYLPPVQFIDDKRLVASTERAALVWDVVANQQLFKSAGFAKEVSALAVSPDGRQFMAGSRDGTVRVWDAVTFDETARFDWQVGKVNAVAFAPDGLTAAVAGDGGVVVWDVE